MCRNLLTWISFTVEVARNRFIVIGFDCCFRLFLFYFFILPFRLLCLPPNLPLSLPLFSILFSCLFLFLRRPPYMYLPLSLISPFFLFPLYILIKFLYVLITSVDSCFGYQFLSLVRRNTCKNGRLLSWNEKLSLSEQNTLQTEQSVGSLGKWPWFRLDCVAVLVFLAAKTCLRHTNLKELSRSS